MTGAEDDGRVASLEIIDLRGSAGIGSVLARHEDFQASRLELDIGNRLGRPLRLRIEGA